MIDITIKNEGIEKEPPWRRLSGWSRFAWKFHFKVWSITEEMEPIKAIFPMMGDEDPKEEIYFTNATEEIQVFLMIPESLVESYGQIEAHPGGDTFHITTKRDKNTFLISEKEEKVRKRIREWVEEGTMAISWLYGQTESMSREVIVEHRRAHPRFWTFFTFVALFLILGANISLRIFPFYKFNEIDYFWDFCLVLFVSAYFYTNLYDFSFYELKKKTAQRFFMIFLRVAVISIIAIPAPILIINNITEKFILEYSIVLALVILSFASLFTYFVEKEKIKRGKIKIRENERVSYLLLKILIQIAAVFLVVFLTSRMLQINMNQFLFISAFAYGIVSISETGEGSVIKWLQT